MWVGMSNKTLLFYTDSVLDVVCRSCCQGVRIQEVLRSYTQVCMGVYLYLCLKPKYPELIQMTLPKFQKYHF